MDERALRVLDFFQFLQTLKDQSSSEVGQALCLSLRPCGEKGKVEILLREAAEASDIMQENGPLPVEGVYEVRPLLPRARVEGGCLLPEDFLRIKSTLSAAGKTKHFLLGADAQHPLVHQWGEKIPDFRKLKEILDTAIGPRGEILDSASPDLRRLRQEIARIRSQIRSALETLWEQEGLRKIFQERIITLRNERYVVAVKSECKNTLPGIIHDHSQSRATYFIEPLSTVDENNELNLLLKDEKEEERRVLLELTARIRAKAGEISQAVEVLGYLDLVFAKAKCARSFNGSIPLLNDQGRWHLRRARHPLLDSRFAVSIDLLLAEGQSTLIITGANTGGKTVALKTLGLLTLMAQCGIPIPAAEGSEAAVFNKIFADIGDEQSLQDNLSTFSAWVQTASRIVKEATGSSLVLMDEVGGGTDPSEGAALTMALIDELRNRGAKTVVTTHLNLIKAYGAIHPDVVNVSVEFNPDTLRPTYRLIYGRPGESYALPMAEKWGFEHGLVERARTYLGEGDRKVGKLLQSLERTQQEIEAKHQETERLKREAEASSKEADALLFRARREVENLLAQSREKARALVQRAKDDLREMINEFKAKGRTDVHRLSQDIRAEEEKINCLTWGGPQEGLADGRKQKVGPNLGSAETLKTLGQLGEALASNSGQKEKKIQAARPAFIQYRIPAAAREIKVIGLHVEEALPLLDKAIDEAFLGGLKEIDVIHGAGTGKLRTAIREYLHGHACVKQFLPGGPGRGGDGVTVVEIGPAPPVVSSGRRLRKNGLEQG